MTSDLQAQAQRVMQRYGFAITTHRAVPRGTTLHVDSRGGFMFNPLDAWAVFGVGPTPLYTRHTLGAREARRDRRRHG